MTVQTSQYTSLITSEHQSAPNFMAMVSLLAQWAADRQNMLASIPALYDIDSAVASQLDAVGLWVGISRKLSVPLTNVYFSLDVAGLGLDQGVIQGPFDPTTGLVSLPDAQYRILLYATIAANNWDGTVPGAYTAWNTVFQPLGYSILIQDFQNMTMGIALVGPTPDAVTLALFKGGYLNLVPAGVGVAFYFEQSVPGTPIFGLDAENSSIAGLDVGAMALIVGP
ncbi:DUF2612 domain-containing protein [Paraburkholderia bryophila]|uniref:DUF2612 domain-containing protein n=1 Tax=Paraburkholderia bryophila TaxID=420952 RepID=UPI00234A78F5|nr:DUF2612 domain-containing protein [Paraburkholderia bryophila]WCM21350.1 DUF2612 domain-containing protein [Paraburkholderia bryophila]